MSGTYPQSPSFNAIGFRSVSYNVTSTTISGRTQSRNIGGQRFEFSASHPNMTRAEFAPINAFIMRQNGSLETFQIVLPEISKKSGNASGSVVVDGAHSIGDKTINVSGLTGTLKAGDMIKFADHTKVYMIVSDATGVAGDATVSIEPGLREALDNAEAVTYDDVPFTVRLENDTQEYSAGLSSLVTFEVDMIEAI